jgi:hypothetical protein
MCFRDGVPLSCQMARRRPRVLPLARRGYIPGITPHRAAIGQRHRHAQVAQVEAVLPAPPDQPAPASFISRSPTDTRTVRPVAREDLGAGPGASGGRAAERTGPDLLQQSGRPRRAYLFTVF